MTVTFRVEGRTMAEIRSNANQVLAKFVATGNYSYGMSIDAEPLITSFGSDEPRLWAATVTVTDLRQK